MGRVPLLFFSQRKTRESCQGGLGILFVHACWSSGRPANDSLTIQDIGPAIGWDQIPVLSQS